MSRDDADHVWTDEEREAFQRTFRDEHVARMRERAGLHSADVRDKRASDYLAGLEKMGATVRGLTRKRLSSRDVTTSPEDHAKMIQALADLARWVQAELSAVGVQAGAQQVDARQTSLWGRA